MSALVQSEHGHDWALRAMTYENLRALLTPRVMRSTNLFVLDLFRSYSTGLRAEGMAVAQALLDHGDVPLEGV